MTGSGPRTRCLWQQFTVSQLVHWRLELHHALQRPQAVHYITMHCSQNHLRGPGNKAPGVPPSRIDLAREEVDEGEGSNRPEPPVERRQDDELHPADRPGVEVVSAGALNLQCNYAMQRKINQCSSTLINQEFMSIIGIKRVTIVACTHGKY